MARFRRGELDVLVATTVIEVGVDVPNATVMVIEHAERFGLAQLHQLRGRVGRGGGAVVLPADRPMAGERGRRRRLDALVETTDGFEIAEKDLELRGPGELLGTRQSGLSEHSASSTGAPTARRPSARGTRRRTPRRVRRSPCRRGRPGLRGGRCRRLRCSTREDHRRLAQGGADLRAEGARHEADRRPGAGGRLQPARPGSPGGSGRARPLRRLGRDGARGALARRRTRDLRRERQRRLPHDQSQPRQARPGGRAGPLPGRRSPPCAPMPARAPATISSSSTRPTGGYSSPAKRAD